MRQTQKAFIESIQTDPRFTVAPRGTVYLADAERTQRSLALGNHVRYILTGWALGETDDGMSLERFEIGSRAVRYFKSA